MTDDLLKRASQLDADATPGPWEVGDGFGCAVVYAHDRRINGDEPIAIDLIVADAALIVLYRNELPAILAALESDRAKLAEAQQTIADFERQGVLLNEEGLKLDAERAVDRALLRRMSEMRAAASSLCLAVDDCFEHTMPDDVDEGAVTVDVALDVQCVNDVYVALQRMREALERAIPL